MELKDIIRFKKNKKQELIHYQVTEEQAQEWCSSPLTRTDKYFDGFAPSGTYCTKQSPKYNHYFTPTEEYK